MKQGDVLAQIKELAKQFETDLGYLIGEFNSSFQNFSTHLKHLEQTQNRAQSIQDLSGRLENPVDLQEEFWKKIANKQKEDITALGGIILEREKTIRQLSRSFATSLALTSHTLLRQISFTQTLIQNCGEGIISQSSDPQAIRGDLRYILENHAAWKRSLTKAYEMLNGIKDFREDSFKLRSIFIALQKYSEEIKSGTFPIFQFHDPGEMQIITDAGILSVILKELVGNASKHNSHVRNIHLRYHSIPSNPNFLYIFVMQDEPIANPFHFAIGKETTRDKKPHIPIGLGVVYILSFLLSPEGIGTVSKPRQHGFYLLVKRG